MNKEQYEYLKKKFEKLIYEIGHRISGDRATCSLEDNVQDLWMTVYDSIKAYGKKEKQELHEFIESEGFTKYLKTCLWHKKANKGLKAVEKTRRLNAESLSFLGGKELYETQWSNDIQIEDTSYHQWSGFFTDNLPKFTDEEKDAIKHIVMDPMVLKEDGTLSINSLGSKLGKNWPQTNHIVQSISFKLKNQL